MIAGEFRACSQPDENVMSPQIPFGTNDFAVNPEPRVPCVLLLDTSRSMEGERIAQLNSAIVAFGDDVQADGLASKRIEVAVVTFGREVRTLCDFTTLEGCPPITLGTGGKTYMGAGIRHAIDLLRQRRTAYSMHGVLPFRPWILLITDGEPSDEWQSAAEAVKQGEAAREFCFFAVGVEGANFDVLRRISARPPLKLKGTRFRDLFLWLSTSLRRVSHSRPGDSVSLPNPLAPDGWASV